MKKQATFEKHYVLDPDQLRRTWICVHSEKGPRFAYDKSKDKKWDRDLLAASYADEIGIYDVIVEEKTLTTCEARRWAERL
jgi:hypothetical protein